MSAPNVDDSLRSQAVALAAQGFRVFPLLPNGKKPAVESGVYQASSDPARVHRFWSEAFTDEPLPYNIGIATGGGLVVLDEDNKNGKNGALSLESLELRHDDLPATLTVATPSGGKHYYLRAPAGAWLRNSASSLGDGLDVRGDGGYVVAPGSTTENGRYEVVVDAPIAPAPEWLLALVAGARPLRSEAPLAAAVELDQARAFEFSEAYLRDRAPRAIQGDGGRSTTIRVLQMLGDIGLSPDGAIELLTRPGGWNDSAEPPWSDEELTLLACDILTSHREKPLGCGFPWTADDEFEVVDLPDNPLTVLLEGRQKERSREERLTPRNISDCTWKPVSNYVVKGLVNFGGAGLITGKSNAGKSPFALDLCAHVAMGKKWNGRKVRKGYACYVATEGFTGNANRFEGARREYFPDGLPVPFEVIQASVDLRQNSADADAIAKAVIARAAHFQVKPALIIVDTLSHTLAGGNESDPEQMRAWLKHVLRLARQTGAAVLAVHHPPKDGSSLFRGSGFLLNDTDVLIQVETDEKTKVRKVTTPRNKEGAEIDPVHFRIRVVRLGFDDEGEEITTVVLDWVNDHRRSEMPRLSAQEREVLAVVVEKSCPTNTPDGVRAGIFEFGDVPVSTGDVAVELNVRGLSKSTDTNTLKSAARRLLRTLTEHGLLRDSTEKQGHILTNSAEQRVNIREIVRGR